MSPSSISRRNFLHVGGMTLLGAAFQPRVIAAPAAEERKLFSAMGIASSLDKAAALIRATGHPNVRMLADLYHMACVGDTPADLKAAMDVVVHIEIAEKKSRSVPGVSGDDFRPYFRVLRESGYRGAISIEGKWEMSQLANGFGEIARQAVEA